MPLFSHRPSARETQLAQLAERVTALDAELRETRTSLVQSRSSVAFRQAGIASGGETSEHMVLAQVYEQVPWVAAPIDAIADHITAGGWELKPARKGAPPASKQRLEKLFLYVNPDEDMNELVNRTVKALCIFGRAFWEIVWAGTPGKSDPLEVYFVDPVTMSPKYDEYGQITGYVQRMDDGETETFSCDQILMFRETGPRGETLSPIRKLITSATVYNHMMRWGQKFFEHGAKPPFALKLSEDTDDADGDRALEWYAENYSGAENAHKIWLLWGGAEIQELGTSGNMLEMDFLQSIKYLREEFLAILKVPPAIVSVADNGSRLSDMSDQQLKIFRYGATEPRKRLIEEKINYALLQGGFGIDDWTFCLRDIDFRSDAELQALTIKDVERGILSLDEARKARGYEGRVPGGGGDVPVVILQRELVPVHDLPSISSSQIAPQVIPQGDSGTPAATPPSPPTPATPPKGEDEQSAALIDLAKWRRVATRAVREGKALRPFVSDRIDYVTSVTVTEALSQARTVEQINALFEQAATEVRHGRPFGETGPTPPPDTASRGLLLRPSTDARITALSDLLATKTSEHYARTLTAEAAGLNISLHGPVTDPAVLARLRTRADFAAGRIAATYQKQLARRSDGTTVADVVATRDYKPEQIWRYELGQARHAALIDFYGRNAIERTAHVEPADTRQDDECADAIDRGSVPVSDLTPAMPAHPNCPHFWETDPAEQDTLDAVGGLVDAGILWTAGLLPGAGGDDDDDQAPPDDASDDEEETARWDDLWEGNDQTRIAREALKFSVPLSSFDAVKRTLPDILPPDKHDPDYRGQLITSEYFDTPSKALQKRRMKDDGGYVVVRLRNYESGDWFLEVKTPSLKVRHPIDSALARKYLREQGVVEHVEKLWPEIGNRLADLIGQEKLRPVVTMTYRRWAVVKGPRRITLDRDIATDDGGKLGYGVLECKFAGDTAVTLYPPLKKFPLSRLNLSKFLFAVGADDGKLPLDKNKPGSS